MDLIESWSTKKLTRRIELAIDISSTIPHKVINDISGSIMIGTLS